MDDQNEKDKGESILNIRGISETCNLTEIYISNSNIHQFLKLLNLPDCLKILNLSANQLKFVPSQILNLENLQKLDLSENKITYFNICPAFVHSIVNLNLSNNNLHCPPFWLWTDSPENIIELNMNSNMNISMMHMPQQLRDSNSVIKSLKIANCHIKVTFLDILKTMPNIKEIILGANISDSAIMNFIDDFPCDKFEQCRDIERLNLCNNNLYTLNDRICMFHLLKEVDLSMNYINSLPKKFCNLKNLEVCILSNNKLMYLPDEFVILDKLKRLHLDNNDITELPEGFCSLLKLDLLDLYNNCLEIVPSDFHDIQDIDFAQNYFDEPESEKYINSKMNFRAIWVTENRLNGIKMTDDHSDHRSNDSSYEEKSSISDNDVAKHFNPSQDDGNSEEDWDSDEYWIPHTYRINMPPPDAKWIYFAKKKLEEGSFCPFDLHKVPIMDQINYMRAINPQEQYESEGQFDDFSGDDS